MKVLIHCIQCGRIFDGQMMKKHTTYTCPFCGVENIFFMKLRLLK